MPEDTREGSDSRCCQPDGAPYRWLDAQNPNDPAIAQLEAWLATLGAFARDHELGEIDDLFEAAALGKLWDSGDETTPLKPIRTDPDVYELRRKALSKHLRFYHGEPPRYAQILVKLHRHIKVDDESQQVEIDKAVAIYRPHVPPSEEAEAAPAA
ncbi:hypothetical protein [Rathayibacter sp. AY1D1]|uniref:hypothetical protein n=1 Tax=Rathayibacter sp. AY1D1 TaxID=2080542 RepID=UPI0015E2A10B|nr:hypothetical protein [Rathayibacter sp. AY1D1]